MDRFPVTFNGDQPPWSDLQRALLQKMGVEDVYVAEDIQLVPEEQTIDSGEIVDIIFRLQGKTIPVNHIYPLFTAIKSIAPWLSENSGIGVQLLMAGEEGNGWSRENDPDEVLYLSRRTRLMLRIPKSLRAEAEQLVGATLDVSGHEIVIKTCEQQSLSHITTLYARHVALAAEEEPEFLEQVIDVLKALDIRCKKFMCGKKRTIHIENGIVETRSLMLTELSKEDAIKLQQQGIGPHRHLNCGFFVPYKSITTPAKND